MKKSITSLFVLFAVITASAQDKPLTFSNFVSADSTLSKKDLYQRGKVWFTDDFKSAGKEIQNENPDQGILYGKASFQYNPNEVTWSAKTKGTVSYTVKLNFSEGRYKYEITNFVHEGSGISFDRINEDGACKKDIPDASPEWISKVCDDIREQAKAHAVKVIKSLISTMNKS